MSHGKHFTLGECACNFSFSLWTNWEDSWLNEATHCESNTLDPIHEQVIDSLCPQMPHGVFTGLCRYSRVIQFQRSLAALSVNPHGECVFSAVTCVCDRERERKGKMEASVARLPSSLSRLNWGQMLWDAKEPTCLLSECVTYTKLGHSFTYSLPLFPLLPFPTPPDSLYLMQKCGPQLPLPPNRGRS